MFRIKKKGPKSMKTLAFQHPAFELQPDQQPIASICLVLCENGTIRLNWTPNLLPMGGIDILTRGLGVLTKLEMSRQQQAQQQAAAGGVPADPPKPSGCVTCGTGDGYCYEHAPWRAPKEERMDS